MNDSEQLIRAFVMLSNRDKPYLCSKYTEKYKLYYSERFIYVIKVNQYLDNCFNIETDFFKNLIDFSTEEEFTNFSNDVLNNIVDKYLKLRAFI